MRRGAGTSNRLTDAEVADELDRWDDQRWAAILSMKYRSSMTLAEIGRENNVSKERVRQILLKAYERIEKNWPDAAEYLEGA